MHRLHLTIIVSPFCGAAPAGKAVFTLTWPFVDRTVTRTVVGGVYGGFDIGMADRDYAVGQGAGLERFGR